MTDKEFIESGGCIVRFNIPKLTMTKLTNKGKSTLHFTTLQTLNSTKYLLRKNPKFKIK
jgi:hypothetical protein